MTHRPPPAPKKALYRTIRDVATARLALGLSRAAVDYLRRASECVSPDDLADGRAPWCYERVDDMALNLGVDPRTVRNIEKRLADLGLVERRPMANGHRWAKRCRRTGELLWVHGISLKPLIERRDELAALATRIADDERAYRATRQQVHALRARLKEVLAAAQAFPALAALRDRTRAIHDAAPARLLRQVFDLDALRRIRAELALALDALAEAIASLDPAPDEAVEKFSEDDEISDAAEIPPRQKYDTTPNLYSCSRADSPSCREDKRTKGEAGRKPDRHPGPQITARQVLDLAPGRWREALGETGEVDWAMIGFVATARRAELGVSEHAWRAGVEGMGSRRAAVCLAVLDANRAHPTAPVRSVGGAFVAMTRRDATGELHLEPSIRWIAARKAGAGRPEASSGFAPPPEGAQMGGRRSDRRRERT